MHKMFKWTIGVGSGLFVVGATAGAYYGGTLMAAKKKNAEIDDNGLLSTFTNHLPMDATQKLEDVAAAKPVGKKGINILNIGDSIAHGDYTWQVLDSKADMAGTGPHPLKDTPSRIGSYYGFIADAFQKNSLLSPTYKLNYETSVSGLRLFELINWVRTNKYQQLTGHKDSHGNRQIEHAVGNRHAQFVNKGKKITDRIKESDLITLSIGGNDLIRSIKLFGKDFHESFDTAQMAAKLKEVLNGNGTITDILSIDMNGLAEIYQEFERNLQSLFSAIHAINPNTKIIMTAAPSPLIHAPKVLRNLVIPIFSKIEEISRRVMGYKTTTNTATALDPVNMYDHPTVVDEAASVANRVPWLAFAGGDLVSSRNGDPKDVYKPNILDIHPGLEGQGKMAMTMMETMHEAGWLNKKIAYTEDNMLDRANFVRSMHKGDTWADLETNFKALTKPSFDPQTVAELDPDYAYGVVQPSSPTDHDYSAVRKEQKDNAMYGVASNVVGLIDGITDRILINRNLALQNLDFSNNAKFNTFKKYKKAIEGIGELATAKYKEYYDGELAKNPDNVFKLNKLWEEEMIDWYSQQTGISPKDQAKIDAYKAGTVILHKNDATFANIWDIDGDNRFTLSDIQLGQLTPLISDEKDANGKSIPLMDVVDKDDKIITKGKINGVILWTDFSEMVTRALTDMMTGKELRKPSDTNPVGFVVATDDEAKHAVEASGHTWDVFSDKDAILGAAVSSKPMPIGSHMLARALKLAATEHERLAKLLVDNKNSLPDAVAKFLEIMELSHVNQHVVRDFMVHIATDPMLVHEAVQMIFQVLGDKKNDAFGAITSLVPSISSVSSAKDFILRAASKISDSISGIVKELKEPANKAKLDEWGINISDLTAKIMNGNKGGIIAIIGDLLAAIKATHTVKGDMLLGIIKTVLPVIAGMI